MRSRALGVPVDGRQLLGVVLRIGGHSGVPGISAHARVLEAADVLADACRAERVPALVGTLDDVRAGAMLSLRAGAEADAVLTSLAGRVRDRVGAVVIGVGAAADSIKGVGRSFLEAYQVAGVAGAGLCDARPFSRLTDLHLRGLLHLLRDDARTQTFVKRELGPLLACDPATGLVGVLAAFLASGGNKAAAAQASHLARPTFYERLRRIERILGVSLDSAEVRT